MCTVQFSSVSQSCPTFCDPMNCSMPGFPVHHQLPEFTKTLVHRVGDAIQPSLPLLSPSPPALNLYQHQGLFKWVSWSNPALNYSQTMLGSNVRNSTHDKVMRQSSDGKANQTSGFPPGISWASNPLKIRICLLFHSSDILWKKVNSGL